MSSSVPDWSDAKNFWLNELESMADNRWPDGHCPDVIERTLSCFIEGLGQIIDEGSEYLESGRDWHIPPESASEIADSIYDNERFLTACAYYSMDDLRNIRKEMAEKVKRATDQDFDDTLLDAVLEGYFHERDEINSAYEYEDGDTLDNRKASFGTLVATHGILELGGLFPPEDWLYDMRDKVELLGRAKLLKWSKLHIPPRSVAYLDRAIECYLKDIGLDVIAIMCRAALDSAIEDTISQEALIKHYGSAAENPRKHISFGLRYIKDTGVLDSEGVDTLYSIRRIGTDVVHINPSVTPHLKTAEGELAQRLEEVRARQVEKDGEDATTSEQVESLLEAIGPLMLYKFTKASEGFDKLIDPTFSIVGSIASGAGYNRDSN